MQTTMPTSVSERIRNSPRGSAARVVGRSWASAGLRIENRVKPGDTPEMRGGFAGVMKTDVE
jgi:hypothetical protein